MIEIAYQRPNQQPDTGSGIQIRYTFHYNHSSQSARKGTLLPAQESSETKKTISAQYENTVLIISAFYWLHECVSYLSGEDDL